MNSALVRIAGFFLLALIQTAFLTSLPFPFSVVPLVFVAGIWLIQQESSAAGAAWIVAMGLWMDLWGVSPIPGQTIGYALGALAATVSARKLFSHRSLYGALSCFLVSIGCTIVWDAGVQFVTTLTQPEAGSWGAWTEHRLWELALGALVIWIIFSSSKQLRRILGIRAA